MSEANAAILTGLCLGAVVLVVVLVAVGVSRSRRRARLRWAELQLWAEANRWTLVASPVVDWGSRLPGGNKRGVSLALTGEMWGRRTSIAEYSYNEQTSVSGPDGSTSTSTTTHQYVLVVVHLDRPSGYLGVQPRGVLSRWGRTLFGLGASIGDERFDSEYRMVGDPAATTYRLSPELIAAHVAGTVPPWTVAGPELLTWYPGRIDLSRMGDLAGPLHRVAIMLTGAGAAR
jgi:hypothetical protein